MSSADKNKTVKGLHNLTALEVIKFALPLSIAAIGFYVTQTVKPLENRISNVEVVARHADETASTTSVRVEDVLRRIQYLEDIVLKRKATMYDDSVWEELQRLRQATGSSSGKSNKPSTVR